MRHILTLSLLLTGLWVHAQPPEPAVSQAALSKTTATPKLNLPFGTIARLEVEVVDGNRLQMKELEGTYLLKINSVNGLRINDTLLLTFEDETEELAANDAELYKLMFGKKGYEFQSSHLMEDMKHDYVGKKLALMAYETGRFTGMPDEYYKYRPISAGSSFHFQNYLVVVSNLTK